MMTKDKKSAFVDFLYENDECLEGMSYLKAKSAILYLARNGMDASGLMKRACHSAHSKRLLIMLTRIFKGKRKRHALMKTLLTLPTNYWEEHFQMEELPTLFSGGDSDIDYIRQHHNEILTDEQHPLFRCVGDMDAYWERHIRLYIVKRDFRRAWDELRKAHRGFLSEEGLAEVLKYRSRYSLRGTHRASNTTLKTLVGELYTAMSDGSLIATLPEGNYELENEHTRVAVYETREPRGREHAPRSYNQAIRRAGLELANIFLIQEGSYDYWNNQRKPYIFQREGGMVLLIADYFRQLKNEARRKKHQKALAEYEQRQQKPRQSQSDT
jgi:hypothetical protein